MYSKKLQTAINNEQNKKDFIELVGEEFANTVYVLRHNKYTQWELQCAFDTVANPTHWKCPIDTKIPAIDADIVSYAVSHMAGCIAIVTYMGDIAHVEAEGYYAAVGS